MYRLFSLSALLFLVSAEPKSPKVYNVLISSRQNLSPSHALPVYSPVWRTTSYGIALPSLYYHTPIATLQTAPEEPPAKARKQENDDKPDQTIQMIPVASYVPYSYVYNPYYLTDGVYYTPTEEEQKKDEPDEPVAKARILPEEALGNSEDPKHVIANLKKNPNIPDVPPPALPTRTKT